MGMDIEEKRRRDREWQAKRRAEDPDYRERAKARSKKWAATHREWINEQSRLRYAEDPAFVQQEAERVWRANLKSKYGLTVEDYNRMLDLQGHVCLFCRRPCKRKLSVDHCHQTGLVRALLCNRCNVALGYLRDDPVVARRVADFLELWFAFISHLYNTEETDMTSNDDATEESKASRLMRKAILHELHQPFGVDPPPPTDRLQAIARALVAKAEAQDIQAIKEVLDRIDGKTPSAPNADPNKEMNVSWKFPFSKLNPPNQIPARQIPTKATSVEPRPAAKRSSTSRACSSSRSTSETSGSPAW